MPSTAVTLAVAVASARVLFRLPLCGELIALQRIVVQRRVCEVVDHGRLVNRDLFLDRRLEGGRVRRLTRATKQVIELDARRWRRWSTEAAARV